MIPLMEEELLSELLAEIRENLERLRRDLRSLGPEADDAGTGGFAEGYRREAYEAFCLRGPRVAGVTGEMLHAFYRSLQVMSEGHPGFWNADPEELERAYRITLEAALEMGERLLEGLATQGTRDEEGRGRDG